MKYTNGCLQEGREREIGENKASAFWTAKQLLLPGGSKLIFETASYALLKASLKSFDWPVTAKTRPVHSSGIQAKSG
jgi:hypothetical protein